MSEPTLADRLAAWELAEWVEGVCATYPLVLLPAELRDETVEALREKDAANLGLHVAIRHKDARIAELEAAIREHRETVGNDAGDADSRLWAMIGPHRGNQCSVAGCKLTRVHNHVGEGDDE